MGKDYEIYATPKFIVYCPKHKIVMKKLSNGFIGENLWYCEDCDRPYRLKAQMLKENQFNREKLNRQWRTSK